MRTFYERYSGYMTAVCSRYIGDGDEVKDILQDSFIRAFDAIGRFEYRGEGSLRAWLGRIVANDSLKALRKSGRLRHMDALPEMADLDEADPGSADVPLAVLQQMIKELPDGYRTVFNLHVFEEKSHKEIGELLGIREDSSASQFFRARAMLARKIKEYRKANE